MVGYIPQQKAFDRDLPLRGRDLVRLGLDGHRWGWACRAAARPGQVDAVIAAVGRDGVRGRPIGLLSGGEQQRLRIAQALLGDPRVLLCDEPLLSLDLQHQQAVGGAHRRRRREAGTAVVFVTHEVNPVLPLVDRVLYLVGGRWAIGTPDEVMTERTAHRSVRAPRSTSSGCAAASSSSARPTRPTPSTAATTTTPTPRSRG